MATRRVHLITESADYPDAQYYAICPLCGVNHGSFKNMVDAHQRRHCKRCSLEQVEKVKKAIKELDTAKGRTKKPEAYIMSKLIGEAEELPDFDDAVDDASLDSTLNGDLSYAALERALYWNHFKVNSSGMIIMSWSRYVHTTDGSEYSFYVRLEKDTQVLHLMVFKNGAVQYDCHMEASRSNFMTMLRSAFRENGLRLPVHDIQESEELEEFPDDLPLPDPYSEGPVPHILLKMGFVQDHSLGAPAYVYKNCNIELVARKYTSNNINVPSNMWIVDDYTPAVFSAFSEDCWRMPELKVIEHIKWILATYERQNSNPDMAKIRSMKVGELRAALNAKYTSSALARPVLIGLVARKQGLPFNVLSTREFYAAYWFCATNLRGEAPRGVRPLAHDENVVAGHYPDKSYSYMKDRYRVGTEVIAVPATDVTISNAQDFAKVRAGYTPRPEDVKVITEDVMTENGPDMYKLFAGH